MWSSNCFKWQCRHISIDVWSRMNKTDLFIDLVKTIITNYVLIIIILISIWNPTNARIDYWEDKWRTLNNKCLSLNFQLEITILDFRMHNIQNMIQSPSTFCLCWIHSFFFCEQLKKWEALLESLTSLNEH